MPPVHVIGATGRSGLALTRALLARAIPVVPVVRDAAKWRATGLPGAPKIADLLDAGALRTALAGAERVASSAHARHAAAILAAAPPAARLILLGSTRRFTRWPDDHGRGVIEGETAFLASGRRGVMLHPTMIYGAAGENNVQRLAALLRRLPVVPLPGGGRALVQPIHQDDLTACIVASLDRAWDGPRTLVVAGPVPMTYAAFLRAVAVAAGVTPRPVVALPAGLLMALAPLASRLPFLPKVDGAEIRRLLEDKAFDITAMVQTLGVHPMAFEKGLARTFTAARRAGR